MNAYATQVGGDHYKSMPIQPMEFSMANGMDACQHTIIKYVSRFRTKGGIQDLEKAKHVIDMLIQTETAKAVEQAAQKEFAFDEPGGTESGAEPEAKQCECPACPLQRGESLTSLQELLGALVESTEPEPAPRVFKVESMADLAKLASFLNGRS